MKAFGLAALLLVALMYAGMLSQAGANRSELGLAADHPGSGQPYEVWAFDQGTDMLYIIGPDLTVTQRVSLGEHLRLPHLVDFTSDYRHAVVANPASGDTAIMRGSSREVIAVLPTGPGSHLAKILPDDSAIIAAVIGTGTMVEIVPDWQKEEFRIGRSLEIAADPLFRERAAEFSGSSPIFHDYTVNGRYAYITLGPALAAGGVVVMDTGKFELVAVFPPAEVRANLDVKLAPGGAKMYVSGGSVTEGYWYVFATATHELLSGPHSAAGSEAHGLEFTPDGSELWLVNRASSNAIIIDPETDKVIEEIDFVGKSPDMIAMSPDGRYAFVTLRGPNPLTGPHVIAGDTPGLAVIAIASRKIVALIQPDEGNPESDFHGVGVRLLGGDSR